MPNRRPTPLMSMMRKLAALPASAAPAPRRIGPQGTRCHAGFIHLGQRHSHTVVYRSCCVGKSPPTVAWKS